TGDRVNRVEIQLDVLARTPLIRRAELQRKQFDGYKWDTQMSGVRIGPEVAQELEQLWSQRVEAANQGQALPTVLPADVGRWRSYLTAAEEDLEYVERHRLRDQRRLGGHPAMKELVEAFSRGSISLKGFKEQFDSRARVEWGVFGLKGFAGAMFLNQISNNVPNHVEAERIMRVSVAAPSNRNEARITIDALVDFLQQQIASEGLAPSALKPASASFFLSACWHSQQLDQWPTFYPSARTALQADGVLGRQLRGGDGYLAFVDVFGGLAKALGVSFWTL
ncbi:MAG: hypothetical protein O3B65_04275, partial [Chloroflexi bacterium]|nr:hypothetical protein [Chloroflexota bacterium]